MKKSTLLMSLALFAGTLCGNAATVTTSVMDANTEGSLMKIIADTPNGTATTIDFDFDGTELVLPEGIDEMDLIGKVISFDGMNKKNNTPVILSSVNRLFKMGAESDITFKNLKFTGCKNIVMTVTGTAKMTMTNCEAYNNKDVDKKVNGAVIRISGGTVVIDQCYFYENESKGGYSGGVICIYDGVNARITNSSFVHNISTNGGAIAVNSRADKATPEVYIANCTFANNYAADRGGAIYMQHAHKSNGFSPVVVNNTFVGNISGNPTSDDGGAINLWARATAVAMTPVIVNNLFAQNFFDPWTSSRLNDIKCFYLEGDVSGGTEQPQTVNATAYNNIFAAVEDKFVTIYGAKNGNKTLDFGKDKVFKATAEHPEDLPDEPPFHPTALLEGAVPTATLAEGSIAIGAGIATLEGVEIPTTDAYGNARGANPAVGAVEYGSTGAVNTIEVAKSSIIKAGDVLFISGAENAQVEIYDMAGKVMFTAPVSGEGVVAISSLNAGFYIAKVGNAVCKFVK